MGKYLQSAKERLRGIPLAWALVLLVCRPKRFMLEFVHAYTDYRRFRNSARGFRDFARRGTTTSGGTSRGLLVVAGRAMNAQWTQLWSVLAAVYPSRGYVPYVLTGRASPMQNLYFRFFGIRCIYLEDLAIDAVSVPPEVTAQFDRLVTFQQFKEFAIDGVPLGKMALSTYSRLRATGIMDVADPEARREVCGWLAHLYRALLVAESLYKKHNIDLLFFTEVFMEEYGAFYYAALNRELNIIRFAGTVRDNAIVVHHLNRRSDRTHFSALTAESWARVASYPESPLMEQELQQNFLDRYGDRWALSKRNQPNARILPAGEARAFLGVPADRPIAVIFSHILYDTLFFNGEDLFQSYVEWLVETVKAAVQNPNVQWFVKVHPSNLWRGELEYYHQRKYEEVRLIEKYIGALPDHVKLVYPDTPLSPYTWLQLADFGITVRGTSGIELGALGKTVVTAGTGRYENMGFSLNPRSVPEYLALLAAIPVIPRVTPEQHARGKRFAYATFCMKPYTLTYLQPVTRAGKSRIFSSDDLVYVGNFPEPMSELPLAMRRFVDWSFDRDEVDFLNPWPAPTANAQEPARAERAIKIGAPTA